MTIRPLVKAASFLLVLPVVALVPALMPASQAHAQMRICKSHSTDSHDRARLRTAMQKVLASDLSADGVPYICRNPGSAYASLSTVPRQRPDRVTEWWDVTCERDQRQWTCDTPTHRQLIWVYATVDGVLRRLEVSFDETTGLARARALAVQAVQILQAVGDPPPVCGRRLNLADQGDWEKSRHRLTPDETSVEVSVFADEPGAFDVSTVGGGGIELIFKEQGGEPLSQPVCWLVSIVVT